MNDTNALVVYKEGGKEELIRLGDKEKQSWHKRTITFERDLIKSRAFLSLRNVTAAKMLFWFLGKRRMIKRQDHLTREWIWVIDNNFQIEFTYKEAESLGFTRRAFSGGLSELYERGFIDVRDAGIGKVGARTLYALSERWRRWSPGGVEVVRPKRSTYIPKEFPKKKSMVG